MISSRTRSLAILRVVGHGAGTTAAQQLVVDAAPSHVVNTFSPLRALGSGLDRMPSKAADQTLRNPTLTTLLSVGWQAILYRQDTELGLRGTLSAVRPGHSSSGPSPQTGWSAAGWRSTAGSGAGHVRAAWCWPDRSDLRPAHDVEPIVRFVPGGKGQPPGTCALHSTRTITARTRPRRTRVASTGTGAVAAGGWHACHCDASSGGPVVGWGFASYR